MDTRKNENENRASGADSKQHSSELYERTGSTEHNDYKISATNERASSEKKDEKDSYQDYNGNSEENNPARTER
jgi:hypothetical protein